MPLTPSRRSEVPPFTVMTVLQAVAEARAQGREVISLCAGEPGQGAPGPVRDVAAHLMINEIPLGYSETRGLLALRQAIAGHYLKWYDLDLDPARICVTTGSSGAFLLAFLSAFDPGDRVAVARPGYPAYVNILRSLGCEVVELDTGEEVRFQPTAELLAAAHTQAPLTGVILASPANPTGTMIADSELEAILTWCRDNEVRVVSDEIYHGVTFTGSVGTCAWQLDENAVVISSFSKYWGMTGWRLGWMLMPADLAPRIDALAGNLALCAPVPAQHAAVAGFTDESYAECERAVAGFALARKIVLDAIPRLGWAGVAPADGAFYVYAGIRDQLGPYADSIAWCSALLAEQDVAVTPGTDFDGAHGHEYIRLSLARGPDAVAEAIRRILPFQHSLANRGTSASVPRRKF
ncbi:MAG: aminotransferase class I/II-fold pyridoxal phosphate-dependent enzyme [Actinobacteria bacterium]|nr:aminotransferase class I/II-fold pyridoxal phosphate-dependent enzyme [Actinomycetota bacterium]